MTIEKIIKFAEREKDYLKAASLYGIVKIAECIPTSLYIHKYGIDKENNPIVKIFMHNLRVDFGLVTNQIIFSSLILGSLSYINKESEHRIGTKILYGADAFFGLVAITNWIQYFYK